MYRIDERNVHARVRTSPGTKPMASAAARGARGSRRMAGDLIAAAEEIPHPTRAVDDGGASQEDVRAGPPAVQWCAAEYRLLHGWTAPTAAASAMREDAAAIVCVAPMMKWTNRHYRCMARMLSKRVVLYTEMVCASTLVHNPNPRDMMWDPAREAFHGHSVSASGAACKGADGVVLQLGGADPDQLRFAAEMAVRRYKYSALNLNCGCPSKKVTGEKGGRFGAALMLEPELVAACCDAMHEGAGPGVPITVKCRIGVGYTESYELLHRFVSIVTASGVVEHIIVHARAAILDGIVSTTGNRSIPPLRYEFVRALVRDFPGVRFTLNGGVASLALAQRLLGASAGGPGRSDGNEAMGAHCHGVMIGRAAYRSAWLLAGVDRFMYGDAGKGDGVDDEEGHVTRRAVFTQYAQYADECYVRSHCDAAGTRIGVADSGGDSAEGKSEAVCGGPKQVHSLKGENRLVQELLHPLLGLVTGMRGSKKFTRKLEECVAHSREQVRQRKSAAALSGDDNATAGAQGRVALPSSYIMEAIACLDARELDETYGDRHDALLDE